MPATAWLEPAPYANGHKPLVAWSTTAVEPDPGQPAPGGVGGVPAGYERQIQSFDGSQDALYDYFHGVFSGGWPAYSTPFTTEPNSPNPAVGSGG